MKPDEMCQEENPVEFPPKEVKLLWPSSRGELLGFASALERGKSGITAAQIRLAVQLADETFRNLTGESELEWLRNRVRELEDRKAGLERQVEELQGRPER
jgi:hypothetical protein